MFRRGALSMIFLALASVVVSCGGVRGNAGAPPVAEEGGWLPSAASIAAWLRAVAVPTPHGLAWPADPEDPASVSPNLYSGSAGVVLFLLEYARVSGDAGALLDAGRGASALASGIPTQLGGENAGLYTGAPGVAFVLNEVSRAIRDASFERAARVVVDLLERDARRTRSGVEWSRSLDIISGTAGTCLFLLYADREMGHPSALPLARLAGNRLLEAAERVGPDLRWRVEPGAPREMPNFSHGTAGVAYALTTLYLRTRERRYLDGAVAGARYLTRIADRSNGGFRVRHSDPDGLDIAYLGWCHGPAGTSRLFHQLWRATGDEEWRQLYGACARAILTSGVPERSDPGLWDNVGTCCGSTGIAEALVHAAEWTGDNAYFAQAQALTRDALARGVRDARGLRFPSAEHRIHPELRIAQAGLMQGAAGVGLWLLALDAFTAGRRPGFVLPDSPFG